MKQWVCDQCGYTDSSGFSFTEIKPRILAVGMKDQYDLYVGCLEIHLKLIKNKGVLK